MLTQVGNQSRQNVPVRPQLGLIGENGAIVPKKGHERLSEGPEGNRRAVFNAPPA
jgi:hypothetical protein